MLKYAITIAILLSACITETYSGDPMQNAIDTFEQTHGPLSEVCHHRVYKTDVIYEVRTVVETECESRQAVGCLRKYDAVSTMVMVEESQGPAVLAHEYMHVILRCMVIEGNVDHTDSVWQDERVR